MPDIPDDVKQQALAAVEPIRGMARGGDIPDNEGFAKDNSSYQTLVDGARSVVDSYSQDMATAREQQRTNSMERKAEMQQEQGRDR